jgi:putative nucleotidyltransferase with HDIG domain
MAGKRDPVIEMLTMLGELPTLPTVAIEVAELLDNPDSTPKQITAVMKADQVLTSKVLKLVNSAYYAIPGGVSTVERAIAFLGYNTIFQLLIGVSVVEFSRLGGAAGIDIREFWKHSLGVAIAAEIVGQRIGYAAKEELFAGGLLHDIGKIALAKVARKKFSLAVEQARKDGITLLNAEKEQGLPTHDKIGGTLAEQWRFPAGLRAAIGAHHRSYNARLVTVSKNFQAMLDIIVLADTLCRRFGIGNSGDLVVPEVDKDSIERLGLFVKDLPQIKGEMTRKVEKSKVFLDLLADNL